MADTLLLILLMNKFFRYIIVKLKCFSILKPKVVYLYPFLSFLTFSKIRKQNFMYFERKHVEN